MISENSTQWAGAEATKMTSARLIRSATLEGYVSAAEQVGLDANAMLQKVGLRPEYISQPDFPIPFDAFVALLQHCADTSAHYDFGIRAAMARGIPDLGPVSLLIREDETLLDALHTMISRLYLHADGTMVALDTSSGDPFLSIRIVANEQTCTSQATEFSACGAVHIIRWLIGSEWSPRMVCFAHPSHGQTRLHQKFFQAPVRYDQPISGFPIPRDILSVCIKHSSPSLRRQARRLLEASLSTASDNFSWRVLQLISQMLAEGECSAGLIAFHLRMDRRTLSRRLEREGSSFSALLQQARRDIALQHVSNRRASLTEATLATGFQSLSSFCRWFRSTFGRPASEWRHEQS
jgi:AraC-like DNA-binding protein